MTPEQEAMLVETCRGVAAIAQELKGYNGKRGLLEDYEAHKKEDVAFRREFYRFRTWVYILVAFAAGGGGAVGAGLTRWLIK